MIKYCLTCCASGGDEEGGLRSKAYKIISALSLGGDGEFEVVSVDDDGLRRIPDDVAVRRRGSEGRNGLLERGVADDPVGDRPLEHRF